MWRRNQLLANKSRKGPLQGFLQACVLWEKLGRQASPNLSVRLAGVPVCFYSFPFLAKMNLFQTETHHVCRSTPVVVVFDLDSALFVRPILSYKKSFKTWLSGPWTATLKDGCAKQMTALKPRHMLCICSAQCHSSPLQPSSWLHNHIYNWMFQLATARFTWGLKANWQTILSMTYP